jgi:hypothetical protein
MRPVGSHGSLSLLSVMKVMVSHFVSNSHKGYDCTHCHVTFKWLLLQFHKYGYDLAAGKKNCRVTIG